MTDTGSGELTVNIATDFSSANRCFYGDDRSGVNTFMATIASKAAGSAAMPPQRMPEARRILPLAMLPDLEIRHEISL